MRALKFKVSIGPGEQVVIDLPHDTRGQQAEVIVLLDSEPQTSDASAERVAAWLATIRGDGPFRSREAIDREIAEERASWGD